MNETVLTNARIVLADEVVTGSLVMRDGKIAEVASNNARTGEDMEGDYVIPGLVELHTDHLEGHYAPRPKVRWNPVASVLAHDAQVATAGITTVFDALRVGMDYDADLTIEDMRKLAGAIEESVARDRLRADHFIHLRCEVSAADCVEAFRQFDGDDRVKLASLMDHAPGQRQFARLEAYALYYQGKLKMSDEAFRDYCEKRMAQSAKNSGPNRVAISEACRALAAGGMLDILSSDYIPFSLIQSAFFLGEAVEAISLPQAVAMVSKNPAEAVGLDDRGVIEAGRRADLVRVRVDDHIPVVRTVWRQGRRVA